MGMTLKWRPLDSGSNLATSTPSRVLEILEEAFGRAPMRIGVGDLSVLRALAKALPGDGALPALIKAIEEHDDIEVEASS
jgi:ATP phosphoribosyltransferase regulatory subunit HisZ